MAAETVTGLETDKWLDFNNLVALHGLHKLVNSMGTQNQNGMQLRNALSMLHLPPFTAPTGIGIEASLFGQDRALDVEVSYDEDNEWDWLHPRSLQYAEAVEHRNQYEDYFIGNYMEHDHPSGFTGLGDLYVYNADRTIRVHLDDDVLGLVILQEASEVQAV